MADRAPALLFDLDGTLVDSVYQHVLAWHEVLGKAGMELSVWRIHRRIGMSGGLFVNALLRETGKQLSSEEANGLRARHAEAFVRRMGEVRPLPGARDLLSRLTQQGVPWAIATSGSPQTAGPSIAMLGVEPKVVITRADVAHAKPDPDLFLAAAGRAVDGDDLSDAGQRADLWRRLPAGGGRSENEGGISPWRAAPVRWAPGQRVRRISGRAARRRRRHPGQGDRATSGTGSRPPLPGVLTWQQAKAGPASGFHAPASATDRRRTTR